MGETTTIRENVKHESQYRSFMPGWNQVPIGMAAQVKFQIMATLGLNSRQSFNNYRAGKVRMSPAEAEDVERILREAGARAPIWHSIKNK